MKGLKGIMSLMLVSLMVTSCVTLHGQFDVKQVMLAKKKAGFLNLKTSMVEIKPDLYNAELKINSDKNYTLQLNGRDKIIIPIKSSKKFNMPSNGLVSISHSDIDQPFDLSGEIITDITNSDRIDAIEDCTFTVTENHCRKICEQPDACKIECKDERVSINGRHEVSYHYKNTYRELNINFLSVDKSDVLASFHGTDTETERVSDYSGLCR